MGILTMFHQKPARKVLRTLDDIMSFVIRKILRLGMFLFYIVVKPYSIYFTSKITRKKLPPISNNLLRIPGIKLAEMIRNQEVKCETVIKAYINRCQEVNPYLNAIVEDRFDDALQEAREIDEKIQSGFKTLDEMKADLPLLGLPLTVKESIKVKGMSNESGRFYKKKQIAQEDAPIVKNAKKRGAVILCVTNTPELCLSWESHNKINGATNNPYDIKRTPGGSSGGEAALLGSGASLMGLCSDVAGSCRLPSMFVGVYAHKPTPFVCSPYGHNPQSEDPHWGTFFTTAPMVRYAEDLDFLLSAVKEENGPELQLFKEIDVTTLNFHFMTEDYSGLTEKISPCIKKSLMKISNHFNAKEAKLPLMKWTLDMSMLSMLNMNFDTIYSKNEEGRRPKTAVRETLKYFIGQSESTLPSISINTLKFAMRQVPKPRKRQLENIKKQLKEDILTLLGDNGVLFYPTYPSSANKHYEIYYRLFDPCYMMIFNTLGLPVTQVHTGFDKDNLPIGIQIVGTPGNDHLSIAVAREIQKTFGGWTPAEEIELLSK